MIKQAIIPLAGLGTRLLPLTSVFAKELLTINGKPGLEYILDDCINAGIKDIIKKKKDKRIVSEYQKILKYKKMIKFVYQDKPLGTGNAVLKTEKFIKDDYFLMLFPDDLIMKKNCSKSMIATHKKHKCSVMACIDVNKKDVSRWGIYDTAKKLNKNNFLINGVIEKPSQKKAPSNKAVIGRYILPKTIFTKLKKLKPGKGSEIHITDAIQSLIDDNNRFIAHKFKGKYLDCGTMKGYIKSSLEISKI